MEKLTNAFEKVIRQYAPRLYAFALRLNYSPAAAEDLVAHVFHHYWEAYDPTAPINHKEVCFEYAVIEAFLTPRTPIEEQVSYTSPFALLQCNTWGNLKQICFALKTFENFDDETIARLTRYKVREVRKVLTSATEDIEAHPLSLKDDVLPLPDWSAEAQDAFVEKVIAGLSPRTTAQPTLWKQVEPWLYLLLLFIGMILMVSMMRECQKKLRDTEQGVEIKEKIKQ